MAWHPQGHRGGGQPGYEEPATGFGSDHHARRHAPVPGTRRHASAHERGRSPDRPRFIHEGRIVQHTGGTIFDKLTDPSLYTGSHKTRFDAQGRGRGLDGRDSATTYAIEAVAATKAGSGAPFGGDDREGQRWAGSLRSTFYSRTVDEQSRMRQAQREHEREVQQRYRAARRQIDAGATFNDVRGGGGGGDGAYMIEPIRERWVLDPRTGDMVLQEHIEPQHDYTAPPPPPPPEQSWVQADRRYDGSYASAASGAHVHWTESPAAHRHAQPNFYASTLPPPDAASRQAEAMLAAAQTPAAGYGREGAGRVPSISAAEGVPERPVASWEERALGVRSALDAPGDTQHQAHPGHEGSFYGGGGSGEVTTRSHQLLSGGPPGDPPESSSLLQWQREPRQHHAHGSMPAPGFGRHAPAHGYHSQHSPHDESVDTRRWIDDPQSSRAPTVDELLRAVEARRMR